MSLIIPVDEGLCMRLLEPRHAEELWPVLDANREHIGRWMPWIHATHSVEDVRQAAARFLQAYAERQSLTVSILDRGRIVGGTGWTDWQTGTRFNGTVQQGSADIGYWLAGSAQGRGLVVRCVRRLLDLAFEEHGLFRVTIRAEPGNERSNAVPRRLGFTHEGTLRRVCVYQGRRVDHYLWSMLAEEWKARRHD